MLAIVLIPLAIWWLAKRSRLAWSWNPVSWWDEATGLGARIANDVKSWVLSVVNQAANFLANDILFVFQYFSQAIEYAWGLISGVERLAFTWVNDALQWAGNAIVSLERLAYQWVEDAITWAGREILALQRLAYGWVTDAVTWAGREILALQRLAYGWVTDAVTWAGREILGLERLAYQWVNDAIRWATKAIAAAVTYVYGLVKKDFIDPIWTYLDWVVKAFDWVVWFAEHPFKALHDAETDVIKWTDHMADRAAQEVQSAQFKDGIDAMGKYLGF